jgi:hypothetical protein
MAYRVKFIDPDYRRDPPRGSGDRFCCRCQKAIKPGQPHRTVHEVDGGAYALHPEDEALFDKPTGDMGWWRVGMDCARKIGLEWTHPPFTGEAA